MSVQNNENTRDLVSENELEETTIESFAQGTALSNFTDGDLNKNSKPFKTGQTLDLDENDQELKIQTKICDLGRRSKGQRRKLKLKSIA
jgi:hypothetical protein